jgi:hypothetical protein
MTMVAFNLPSKLSQMAAFKVQSPLQALQSLFQALQSPYGSLQYSFQALQSSFQALQSPSRTSKNPLKTLLAKMSEMNEMRNRMREKGVNECFNLLPNPRLPFPCFISLKNQKKKRATGAGSSQGGVLPRSLGFNYSVVKLIHLIILEVNGLSALLHLVAIHT